MNMTGNITEHFTWEEAIGSETAKEKGIINIPSRSATSNIFYSAAKMEKVRELLGGVPLKISSWFRCLELNRAIGSLDTSQHILGEAIDFKPVGMSLAEAFSIIAESKLDFDQCILERTIIHISFTTRKLPRRQAIVSPKSQKR